MKKLLILLTVLMPLFSFAENKGSKEQIRIKIRENISSFKDCYSKNFKTNSEPGGFVVLDWDVDNSGSVKRVGVIKTTLNNSTVENCMIDKLKAIKFPPAPTNTVVTVKFPFVFSAKK